MARAPGDGGGQVRVGRGAETCTAAQFLACVERNLDAGDTAAAFAPAVAKHTALKG